MFRPVRETLRIVIRVYVCSFSLPNSPSLDEPDVSMCYHREIEDVVLRVTFRYAWLNCYAGVLCIGDQGFDSATRSIIFVSYLSFLVVLLNRSCLVLERETWEYRLTRRLLYDGVCRM